MSTTLDHLNETGIVVVNVTCDNPSTNWAMMKKLGAKLDSLDLKVTKLNILGIPILVIFDVCHLIKLLRNTLGDYKTLLDSNDNEIDWKYFVKLHEIQASSGLHLANNFRAKHLDWQANKMKTCLAIQTFSKSVGKSLIYCRDIAKSADFLDCEQTVKFINIVNDMFDFLNSKSKFAKECKGPISQTNFEIWSSRFEEFASYISTLKHKDGKSVLTGPRKATFLGFLVALKSIRHIYDLYVQTNHLKYVLTFKFSQDHLGKLVLNYNLSSNRYSLKK